MRNMLVFLALAGLCSVVRADVVETADGYYIHGTILYQDADSLTIQVRGTDSVKVLRAAEVERVVIIPRRPGAPAAADEPPVTAPGIPVSAAPADTPRINPAARVPSASRARLLEAGLFTGGCIFEGGGALALAIGAIEWLLAAASVIDDVPPTPDEIRQAKKEAESVMNLGVGLASVGLILQGISLIHAAATVQSASPTPPPDTTKPKPVK